MYYTYQIKDIVWKKMTQLWYTLTFYLIDVLKPIERLEVFQQWVGRQTGLPTSTASHWNKKIKLIELKRCVY